MLPLKDCRNHSCKCSYQHHPDRRQGEDRRLPELALSTQLYGEQVEQNCRRSKRGRRREDLA